MNISITTTAPAATEFTNGMDRYAYIHLLESYKYETLFPELSLDADGIEMLSKYMQGRLSAGDLFRFEAKYCGKDEKILNKLDSTKERIQAIRSTVRN